MKTISFLTLCAMLFALCGSVDAQQPKKVPRIGFLTAVPLSALAGRTDAFRQGLRELGYVEGKNILVELRSADGKSDRLHVLVDEFVRLKMDVIVTGGGGTTRLVKDATSTIPIVMAQDSDPVGNGFIASLARPGGNITGLSNLSSDLVGKRLELLKEVVPRLSRLAVFGTSSNLDNKREVKEIENTAAAFGVKFQYVDILAPKDTDPAFRAATKGRAEAVLWIVSGPIGRANRKEIVELAVKSRLPVIYDYEAYVEGGGLMAYGPLIGDLYHRAAVYVDKILKGAKPADLPVEQPTKFELIINLKAAKQIGLTIPPNVLARATKIIR
jgi:putative ABC transport system substrate-binding protein